VRRGAGAALAAALAAASAGAAEWRVPSAETPSLVHALALAADGDTAPSASSARCGSSGRRSRCSTAGAAGPS
jgi:hypothetical protein